jgi:phosphinothricin acetyltransferase
MSVIAERSMILRDCRDGDVSAIARIYGHWVRHGLGTFEYEPPSEDEIAERRAALQSKDFPYLVAEDEGVILGYAYAGPYRGRPGYRFSCEDSIYVAPQASGRGVGRALLSALMSRCEEKGLRLMIAVIGDSGNAASIGLHAALGFRHAGVLPAVGWKLARWVDTVFMVRPLGAGASSPPEAL